MPLGRPGAASLFHRFLAPRLQFPAGLSEKTDMVAYFALGYVASAVVFYVGMRRGAQKFAEEPLQATHPAPVAAQQEDVRRSEAA